MVWFTIVHICTFVPGKSENFICLSVYPLGYTSSLLFYSCLLGNLGLPPDPFSDAVSIFIADFLLSTV